jgi:hypothetical protein
VSSHEQVLAGGHSVVYRSSPANDGIAGVPNYYTYYPHSPPAIPQKKLTTTQKKGMRPITTDRMPFFHIFSLYW